MTSEPEDFGALFREQVDALYGLARRLLGDAAEAEDAVQEAFLRVAKRGEPVSGLDNPRAWMFRILRNICIDRRRVLARRATRLSPHPFDEADIAVSTTSTPEADLLGVERIRRLAGAMATLPEVDAEALRLVVVDGLKYHEVAAATGAPIGTVRSRLSRARRTLRAAINEPQAPDGDAKIVRLAPGRSRKNR